ncbi:hypothetical protein [Polyangium spumosum]|uniref:SPOR domain-containing protein n=1 Tax=Polyangium spumosum TaxID=889282 RepID=A0A6N7PMH4_9BACT|nr:hypothetical protein [Polyangium spumosum]MRG93362.1 hypothetical protein [Polyangium spumosum]
MVSRYLALLLLSLVACSKSPAEPDPPPAAAPQGPAVTPLQWTAPAAWTAQDPPKGGPKKAAYKALKVGDDKEDADIEVFFYGTGAEGDPEKRFKEWFDQFDGDAGAKAKRESFEVGALKVETVEVSGTYKIALGPPVGPKKRAAMQMVKENFRLVGAAVKTPDRGTWFFKMVGPSDTVQASRDAFRTTLESAK